MAVIHLELSIDGDVYPELYGVLSRLGEAASRNERVRQLAAAALIYESARIQVMPPALPREAAAPMPAVEAPAAVPVPPVVPLPIETAAAPSTAGLEGLDDPVFAPGDEPALEIDLAIGPGREVPVEEHWAGTPTLEVAVAMAARDLPVLRDVVELHAVRPWPVEHADGEDAVNANPTGETAEIVPIAPKPATRSRLMRMKEKGLFKNG